MVFGTALGEELLNYRQVFVGPSEHGRVTGILKDMQLGVRISFTESAAATRADNVRVGFQDKDASIPFREIVSAEMETATILELLAHIGDYIGFGEARGQQLVEIGVPEFALVLGSSQGFDESALEKFAERGPRGQSRDRRRKPNGGNQTAQRDTGV